VLTALAGGHCAAAQGGFRTEESGLPQPGREDFENLLAFRVSLRRFRRWSPDARDARVVRVDLTRKGNRLITELTEAHLAELHNLAEAFNRLARAGVRR
jgi:hypothetical protein